MDENDYLQKAKDLIQSGEVKAALDALKEASSDADLDKAQDYCPRALEISPGHPFFLQTWQNIQERLGEE